MSFKKPFRAVPIKVGKRYGEKRQREEKQRSREQHQRQRKLEQRYREVEPRYRAVGPRKGKSGKITATHFAGAALLGAVIGSVAVGRDDLSSIIAKAKDLAVMAGLMRARAPQEGDNWSMCDAARAAGTAPIFRGEPGYRDGLDADGDGIACEAYRGG